MKGSGLPSGEDLMASFNKRLDILGCLAGLCASDTVKGRLSLLFPRNLFR